MSQNGNGKLEHVTTEDLQKFSDLHLLAEMLEWISAEISEEDEELEFLLLQASYLIRHREGDVAALRGYWEDGRFGDDDQEQSQVEEDWQEFQRMATQHLGRLWGIKL